MDENMKLIMAEFAKLNERLTKIDDRMAKFEERLMKLEERVTSVETAVSDLNERMTNVETAVSSLDERMTAELEQVNSRLGMLELKADKAQDNYEKLEAYLLTIASDVKNGFYKNKHQFRKLEDQSNAIIKVVEFRSLILLD